MVVAGVPEAPETRALLRAIHSVYQPNKLFCRTRVGRRFLPRLPAAEGPLAYVCSGSACLPPTSDPERIKKLLQRG